MFKYNLFNPIIVIFFYIEGSSTIEYSKDLPKCNRGDNGCIQNAIQFILTNYPHGNEALGLPPIEPITFKQFKIIENIVNNDNNETEPVIIKFFGTKGEFFGFSQAVISVEGFNADSDRSNNVTIKLDIPELIAKSDYLLERLQFRGRHHTGTGKYFAKLNDLQLIIKFLTNIVKKNDGKEYILIENLNVEYIAQKSYAEFKESMDDNRLSENNKQTAFILENANDFFKLLMPSISKEWTTFLNITIGNIFENISVDQLFLD